MTIYKMCLECQGNPNYFAQYEWGGGPRRCKTCDGNLQLELDNEDFKKLKEKNANLKKQLEVCVMLIETMHRTNVEINNFPVIKGMFDAQNIVVEEYIKVIKRYLNEN